MGTDVFLLAIYIACLVLCVMFTKGIQDREAAAAQRDYEEENEVDSLEVETGHGERYSLV